jgi:hypothetical protein
MKPVQLKIPIDHFFTRSSSGTIWGRIYFEIESDQVFPERGWTDMAAAFAGNWLRTLIELADGSATSSSIPFYDGPFTVAISKRKPGFVELAFSRRESVKHSTTARIELLLRNAIDVAHELLANCEQRGWSNADTEALTIGAKQGSLLLPQERPAEGE